MKYINLKCKECRGDINVEVEDGQKFLFCLFCGSRVLLDDESKNVNVSIKKNINIKKEDVARIKENERKIRLKELEVADKESERKKDMKVLILYSLLMFGMIGFLGLWGVWSSLSDRFIRGEPIVVGIFVEFMDSSNEAIEITINRMPLGIQSPGTRRTYYTKLRVGSNTITFTVGDITASRDFEVIKTDYYFHFIVEEVSRFLQSNTLDITFDGLKSP